VRIWEARGIGGEADAVSTKELFSIAAAHAARFRDTTDSRPHRPLRDYAAAVEAFGAPLPELSSPMIDVLDELVATAEPGLHLMTGARFFGWVIGGSHPMGVAADFLTSAWGQNAGNHTASP